MTFQFNMLYANHAKTDKCYIVDGCMQINDGDYIYPESMIESLEEPNIFIFRVRDAKDATHNGDYFLNCDGDDYILARRNMDGSKIVIKPEDFEVSCEKYRADPDDSVWDLLGYDTEDESDDESDDE
jgi:hypothetical protein